MKLYLEADMAAAEGAPFHGGEIVCFTRRKPGRDSPNEDGLLYVASDHDCGVLAVADGAGGASAGARAAALALRALADELGRRGERTCRETILAGFEEANHAVLALGVGAATTLAAVQLHENAMRSYHVGDSLVLVTGQRGRRKLETIAHSPVGYAIEAGVLDEEEAMHHEERHIVSNMVGVADMRVEMSARVDLAPRDTVLLASDGLSDNLHVEELVDLVRKGPLVKAAKRLAALAAERMHAPGEGHPSKPDDVTFVLYRPRPT